LAKQLEAKEALFIEIYDSFRNGYNSNLGGHGHKGAKLTDEHKAKIRMGSRRNSVCVVSDNGAATNKFSSQREAAHELGVSEGTISNHLKSGAIYKKDGWKVTK